MRRAIALAAALMAAGSLFAQSQDSVLEKAREKYAEWLKAQAEATAALAEPDRNVGFSPFSIGFVPGLAIPFGYYDVAFSGATVGALNRDVYGFQGAGVFGLARDIYGFQGAGVFSIAREVHGFQGSGVFNIADGDVEGFQTAGVFNIAKDLRGAQSAGVFNIAEDAHAPLQMAGVFNIATDMEGLQLASVFNIAEDIEGGQVATVFNRAKRIRGLQVGLVNIADDLRGIQIGLVNIAKNGVNDVSLSFEPASGYAFATLQNGSKGLYTVLSIGLPEDDWFDSYEAMRVSAGLGSRIGGRSLYLDYDISASYYLGPDMAKLLAAETWSDIPQSFSGRIFPTLQLSLASRLLGGIYLIGGARFDVDLAQYPGLPEALKSGATASSHDWGGFRFDTYGKYYFGIRL